MKNTHAQYRGTLLLSRTKLLPVSGVQTLVPYGLVYVGVLMAACAIFFYRAGELEGGPGTLWAVLSILISALTFRLLHWGWLGVLAGQFALFAGITIVRGSRKS